MKKLTALTDYSKNKCSTRQQMKWKEHFQKLALMGTQYESQKN
jgi:hypothetical protein